MDTGAALGAASVAALCLSPFWPTLGLAAGVLAFSIAAFAAARTVSGYM